MPRSSSFYLYSILHRVLNYFSLPRSKAARQGEKRLTEYRTPMNLLRRFLDFRNNVSQTHALSPTRNPPVPFDISTLLRWNCTRRCRGGAINCRWSRSHRRSAIVAVEPGDPGRQGRRQLREDYTVGERFCGLRGIFFQDIGSRLLNKVPLNSPFRRRAIDTLFSAMHKVFRRQCGAEDIRGERSTLLGRRRYERTELLPRFAASYVRCLGLNIDFYFNSQVHKRLFPIVNNFAECILQIVNATSHSDISLIKWN